MTDSKISVVETLQNVVAQEWKRNDGAVFTGDLLAGRMVKMGRASSYASAIAEIANSTRGDCIKTDVSFYERTK